VTVSADGHELDGRLNRQKMTAAGCHFKDAAVASTYNQDNSVIARLRRARRLLGSPQPRE